MRKENTTKRRRDALSRDRIVDAAIELLDQFGEDGLTFQALARKLATGAGAIYWHVENKDDLITAASDAVIARTLSTVVDGAVPEDAIRAIALRMFDAVDTHPWLGSAIHRSPGKMPTVRLLERLGSQVVRLGIEGQSLWTAVAAVLSYIMGVAGQNAANAEVGRAGNLNRTAFLDSVADDWASLDGREFPFTRSIADPMRGHDDRADFLAGLDFMLRGMTS